MKKSVILIVFFLLGLSLNVNAGSIPAPIFYEISKKILNKTQSLVEPWDDKVVKGKSPKEKVNSCPLKCQPKKNLNIQNIEVPNLRNSKSLWKIESETKD